MRRRAGFDNLFGFFALFFKIDRHQEFADGFRAHSDFKTGNFAVAVLFFDFAEFFIVYDLFVFENGNRAGVDNDVSGKIDYLFQSLGRHIEDKTYSRRNAPEIPDMGYGSRKLDMSHSFPSDFRFGDFYTALFTGDTLVADTLVFTAVTFPILHRSENPFAEKTVLFGFLGSVIYSFGLGYLALGKFPYFFGGSYTDFNRAEIV